jgi:hypothetical protein
VDEVDEDDRAYRPSRIGMSDFFEKRPVIVFLGALFTVLVCCLFSQCLVRLSKNYNLHLNKYYSKKRYEKAKMIQ